jgi:hypothetical protein
VGFLVDVIALDARAIIEPESPALGEIKRSIADPKPSRGLHVAYEDLNVERRIVV